MAAYKCLPVYPHNGHMHQGLLHEVLTILHMGLQKLLIVACMPDSQTMYIQLMGRHMQCLEGRTWSMLMALQQTFQRSGI